MTKDWRALGGWSALNQECVSEEVGNPVKILVQDLSGQDYKWLQYSA